MNLRTNLRKCLYALGAVAVLAAVVVLTNPPTVQGAPFTYDTLDISPESAWVTTTTITLTGGTNGGTAVADTQPSQTRFVIETVAVYCNLSSGTGADAGVVTYFPTPSNDSGVATYIPLTLQGNYGPSEYRYVGLSNVHLFSDSGTGSGKGTILLGADIAGGTGTGTCTFTLSGYNLSGSSY